MSNAEPLGVAFIEIRPELSNFRAETERAVGVGVGNRPVDVKGEFQLSGVADAKQKIADVASDLQGISSQQLQFTGLDTATGDAQALASSLQEIPGQVSVQVSGLDQAAADAAAMTTQFEKAVDVQSSPDFAQGFITGTQEAVATAVELGEVTEDVNAQIVSGEAVRRSFSAATVQAAASEHLMASETRGQTRAVIEAEAAEREFFRTRARRAGSLGPLRLAGIGVGAGVTLFAATQALRELGDQLRVTGDEAGTTQGKFRNFGAEMLSGNIIGGFKALTNETNTYSAAQLAAIRTTEGLEDALRRMGEAGDIERSALAALEGGLTETPQFLQTRIARTELQGDDEGTLAALREADKRLTQQEKLIRKLPISQRQLNVALEALFGEQQSVRDEIKARTTDAWEASLGRLKKQLDLTTPAGKKAGEAIDEFLVKVREGGKLPPIPVVFDFLISSPTAVAQAKQVEKEMRDAITTAANAGAPSLTDVGLGWVQALIEGIRSQQDELAAVGKETAGTFTSSLSTEFAELEAAGASDAAKIANLRKQRAEAVERQAQLQNKARAGRLARPNQRLTEVANQISSFDSQINAILSKQASDATQAASDAKSASDKILAAADERDQAFIAAIERGFGDKQGRISAAGSSPELSDDIRASIKLRNYLKASIAATRERIQEVRAAGRSAKALVAELAVLRAAKNQVSRAIADLQVDAKQQVLDTRIESAQLDLQILEARVGNDPTSAQTAALVRAHQRVIAALKKAQGLTKRRSLEWKRLQLDIENELAAIRDLKKAQTDAAGETKDFSQQAFAFLQELHGFSSNLASNILPTGSAIGGRGVFSSAPSSSTTAAPFARPPLAPNERVLSPFEQGGGGGNASNAAALREQRGGAATFGQMEKLLNVTQNTNALLRDIRRGVGHPEARHNRLQGKHPVETGVD